MTLLRRIFRRTFGAIAGLLAACSLVVDAGQQQCHTDTDCKSRGGPFAGSRCVNTVCVAAAVGTDAGHDAGHDASRDATHDRAPAVDARRDATGADGGLNRRWACLDHHPVPTASGLPINVTLTFTDFFLSVPVTTVTVKACPNVTDPSCALPVGTAPTDATGMVKLKLPTTNGPFAGYFLITPTLPDAGVRTDASGGGGADGSSPEGGAGDGSTYVTSRIYYSDDPIATDFTDTWALFTNAEEATLASVFQLPPADPSLGIALLTVIDCTGQPAAGVSVEVDTASTETEGFYVSQGIISSTATQTDSSGIAGFVNVPTGARTFTAEFATTRATLGTLSAYLFPGAATYADLGPAFTAN